MPFSPITVNTKTFNQSGDGRYMLSTVAFGQPANYINIKGGSLNKDRTRINGAISRVIEKDVTVDGVTRRISLRVQLLVDAEKTGFTSTEIDNAVLDVSDLSTVAFMDRFMNGES